MKDFVLCCDWGTSSFRLRLVNAFNFQIVEEVKNSKGIASVFNEWKAQTESDESQRYIFYLKHIKEQIELLAKSISKDLSGLPVLLSGMASSTIGIENLPYANLPFGANGKSAIAKIAEQTSFFPHSLLLISGLRSERDVMRGEETQFLGLSDLIQERLGSSTEYILILPGTHSKHIHVSNNEIIKFESFMTGEVFDVISLHSILKESISSDKSAFSIELEAFKEGIKNSINPLMHALFTVRTNQIFEMFSKEENSSYLSALLIGSELRTLQNQNLPVVIAGERKLSELYEVACEELSFNKVVLISSSEIDQATAMGQLKVFHRLKENKLD